MATVMEELLIVLRVDASGLKASLESAVSGVKDASENLQKANEASQSQAGESSRVAVEQLEALKNKTNETSLAMDNAGKNYESLATKWRGAVGSILQMVAAPVAGAFAIGSVVNTYMSGVGEVARLTGAYNEKLDEWTKKRALLARVNKEDIEVYKKGREALTRFNIVMADLSTGIMRTQLPAIRFFIDMLNKFSAWVDRNQPNIIRFLQVTAGVITALLIPSFIKLGIAMATNPLTWIVGGIVALIAVIDDLVTYLRGGESAFGDFWGDVVPLVQSAIDIVAKFYDFIQRIGAVDAVIDSIKNAFSALVGVLGICANLLRIVFSLLTWNPELLFSALSDLGARFEQVFNSVRDIVNDAMNVVFNVFTELLKFFGLGEDKAQRFGEILRETFNIGDVIGWFKEKVAGLIDWMPDFLKPDSLKDWAREYKEANPAQQTILDQRLQSVNNRKQDISNTNNVTIYTNTNDPAKMGQEVTQAMQKANRRDYDINPSESGVR